MFRTGRAHADVSTAATTAQSEGDVQHVDQLAGKKRTRRRRWLDRIVELNFIIQGVLSSNREWRHTGQRKSLPT